MHFKETLFVFIIIRYNINKKNNNNNNPWWFFGPVRITSRLIVRLFVICHNAGDTT